MKSISVIKKKDITKVIVISLLFSLILPMISFVTEATDDTMDSEKSLTTESANSMQDELPSYSVSKSDYGWIYGTVTDQDGNSVDHACIVVYKLAVSVTDAYKSRYVTYSAETGFFRLALLPGVYSVDAYKKGYNSENAVGVSVEKGRGTKVDFVLQKSITITPGLGVLKGTVYGLMQISASNSADAPSSTVKIPLRGARVSIYSLAPTTDAVQNPLTTCFTDGNGSYELKLAPGTYSAIASVGLSYQQKNVKIADTRITVIDFVLKIEKTAVAIDESITSGDFGAEITIQKNPNNNTYDHDITVYNAVTIEPITISSNKLSLQVSGDKTSLGKTIALNIDSSFNLGQRFDVQYDGASLNQAENLTDILDPTDDGIHPEYYIIHTDNGTAQILVSIPHFSENSIIEFLPLSEAVGAIASLVVYGAVLAIVAVLYIGPMWYLRKK